jgi:hypothetical protein
MDYQWIKMVTKNGIQKTKEKRNKSPPLQYVLGIDSNTRTTGWGKIDIQMGVIKKEA